MVTDGSRVYFSSCTQAGCSPYEVSAAGGDTVPLHTSLANAFVSDISPDRSELLVRDCPGLVENSGGPSVTSYCPLWILPALGGSPLRLGSIRASAGSVAAWFPDGKQVVYAQESTLYRAKIDGTQLLRIVAVGEALGLASGNLSTRPFWARWSPDGSRLRFSLQNQTGETSLWEIGADGKNLHPLLSGWNNPPAECCGSWTPDGKYFLFQSRRAGTTNIWAIREERSFIRKTSHEPVQLTTGPASTYFPTPSPDGKKVLVVTAQVRGQLVRYDAASRQFAPYLAGISATGVQLSTDQKWVTYVAYPEGTLWRSKVDGSERLQLTFAPLLAAQPRWSPDGARIAFAGHRAGQAWRLYVISADGTKLEEPLPGHRLGSDPNWSPDGKSLLLGGDSGYEEPGASTLHLEILNLRTHTVWNVPGSDQLWSPRWSPDGRHIAALSRDADHLMLFDFDSQKWTELARMSVGYREWSHSGDYIYFFGVPPVGRDGAILRVRISDRYLEELISLKDFRQPPGDITTDGTWVGLAPDDSPLLLRDTGTQDIYALDVDFP